LELPAPLLVMTVIGLLAFAASGAVAGARAGMDWLGLTTLAAVTAVGGGTLRDLLMVRTPGWLIDFWPTVACIAIAVVGVWIAARLIPGRDHPRWMGLSFTITDAIGLAAFTIVGTDAALDADYSWGPAVVLGVISGIGGGVIRDVIVGRRIAIFTGEVYALAAGVGAVLFVITAGLGSWVPFMAGVAIILIIRLGAIAFGWRVPTLPGESGPPS
jgi:uncharacterized membrane protein YeiH